MVVIERLGRKSEFGCQVAAASCETHSPPDAVPARRRLALDGSNASERTRPATLEGPSACHSLGCRPADFGRDGSAATNARRWACARRICSTVGGPFSSASSSRLYL